MNINKELKDEIWNYCRANNITNIDEFTLKILKQGFTVEKFGATPNVIEKEVQVEVEKVVEKIVEKIVEVKVEVPVEKEVFITDDSKAKQLSEKIKTVESERDEFKKKMEEYKKEMEHFQKEWNNTLKKLEIEQKKNKRDIYGE
jgi:hypothetical protein